MVCEALALNLATKSHFKGDFSHLNECFDKFLTFVTETPFCGCSNINVHTLTGSPVGVFFSFLGGHCTRIPRIFTLCVNVGF